MEPRRATCLGFVALFIGIALSIGGGVMLGIGIHKYEEKKGTCDSLATTVVPTGSHSSHRPNNPTTSPSFNRSAISKQVQNNIDVTRIKNNLEYFTQQPHQAGTQANKAVSSMIKTTWIQNGLEDVHTVSYDVLLSYPDWNNPNRLTISDTQGTKVFESSGVSPDLIPNDGSITTPNVGLQWLAFSPQGTITGDVIFAFKGYAKDFDYLISIGIDVKGKIALIRYGGPFRGDKVKLAEQYGAIGVILYSDPAEVAPNGTKPEDTFPNTVYMPAEGVQRGTVYNGDGDPLSPFYPSKTNLWRSGTVEQARLNGDLPNIPAIPVSYSTALQLFQRMNGPPAPPQYRGGLDCSYNMGPGLKSGMKTTITVNGHFEIRTIQNVIGYIYGSEERDRYVILGNHYDAWVYGAQDPNAGTAVLAEVALAIRTTMVQTGWTPARTIMFANWDAEEYGLFGSTEFVDEFGPILDKRAVVYLNMDCLKGNTTLYVQASPSLEKTVIVASKNVENPRRSEIAQNRPTAYDTWVMTNPDKNNRSVPYLGIPMGGSDQKSFLDYLGVPSVNFYWVDPEKHLTYPLYHTFYESAFTSEHLVDTDEFRVHRALGQYWAEMAIRFADQPTIPYSLSSLTYQVNMNYIPSLATAIQSMNSSYTQDGYQQLSNMATTANVLHRTAIVWDNTQSETTFESPALDRSQINDRMITFERCFVNPRGTSGDQSARHVLFSINKDNSYEGTVMQQVYAVLDAMSSTQDPEELNHLSDQLANQISIVHYSLQCAQNTLQTSI